MFSLSREKPIYNLDRFGNLQRRGPDACGTLLLEVSGGNVGYFHHQRLAILGLDEKYNQPVTLSNGLVGLYNGEIYNFKELGYEYNIHDSSISDVNVAIELFNKLTKSSSIERHQLRKNIQGMYSVLIYDPDRNKIFFGRDQYGIKPLYFHKNDKEIFVASNIQSVQNMTEINKINNREVANYLVSGSYDASSKTMLEEIYSCKPGILYQYCIDTFKLSEIEEIQLLSRNQNINHSLSKQQNDRLLRNSFIRSVKHSLVSDVPITIGLSGGIDSSSIAAVTRYLDPNREINCFSFVSSDPSKSEERYIDRLEKDLNLSINKIYEQSFTFDDLVTTIHAQEHPFVSMSVVAQNKIYREVSNRGFKVCLDGQGADEIICGYRGYPHFLSNTLNANEQGFNKYRKSISLQKQLRLTTQRVLSKRSMSLIRYYIYRLLGRFDDTFLKGEICMKDLISFGDILDINKEYLQNISDVLQRRGLQSLLRHGDRNSMYWGVESRVPFLNNDFVQTAVSISPFLQSPTYGETKVLFKQAMRGITPDYILDRTDKIGFRTSSFEFFSVNKDNILSWLAQCSYRELVDVRKLEKVIRNSEYNEGNHGLVFRALCAQVFLEETCR